MDPRVSEIIEDAETRIAALATEATTQRNYARASALLTLAQRVADAARSLGFVSELQFGDKAEGPSSVGNTLCQRQEGGSPGIVALGSGLRRQRGDPRLCIFNDFRNPGVHSTQYSRRISTVNLK